MPPGRHFSAPPLEAPGGLLLGGVEAPSLRGPAEKAESWLSRTYENQSDFSSGGWHMLAILRSSRLRGQALGRIRRVMLEMRS